jgi:ribonucleoside-diphosphate reductase alpha chain
MKFPNKLAEVVTYRTYLRYVKELGRRETGEEMVNRVADYYREVTPTALVSDDEIDEIRQAMMRLDVMPSMRLAWTAGEPARLNSIGTYNCSYLPIDSIGAFAEAMYLLMHGAGVGYDVSKAVVNQLPPVSLSPTAMWADPPSVDSAHTVVFEDSKEGWAKGLLEALNNSWYGREVKLDVSKIRPEGAPLNTFGGRASGPQPLMKATKFCLDTVEAARGRKITPLEAHDMVCAIAECIVVGGVRRSALISLSDLDDKQLSTAKLGEFWIDAPQRALANNSAIYYRRPEPEEFWREWTTLVASGSGERGIYNRGAALKKAPKRRTLKGKNREQLGN